MSTTRDNRWLFLSSCQVYLDPWISQFIIFSCPSMVDWKLLTIVNSLRQQAIVSSTLL